MSKIPIVKKDDTINKSEDESINGDNNSKLLDDGLASTLNKTIKSNSTNYLSKQELKLKDIFKYLLYLDEVSWFIVIIMPLISLSVLVNVLIFKKFKKSARVLLTLRRKSHGNFAIISRKRNLISYFILSFN